MALYLRRVRYQWMKVSVVIPCYNVERYVRRAAKSALAQTHGDLELIYVDDGSTDGTAKILHELFLEAPGRSQVIRQENKGACAARNAGLARSAGEYIQFLDADDELMPEKIAHQVALAIRHHRPALIIGGSHTFSANGGLVRTVAQRPNDRDVWLDLMRQELNVTSTILWSRDALAAVGGWQEGLGSSQEYELMFRMLKNGATVSFDDRVLTRIHRRASGSITQTGVRLNHIRSIELRAQVLEHVRNTRPAVDTGPYLQALFDLIRILYPYDRRKAMEYFRSLIPKGFHPVRSNATGRGYLVLHKLLGFDRANRLRGWFTWN